MGIWEKLRGSREEGGDIWDAPPRKGRNRAPAWQDMGEGDIWDAPPRRDSAPGQVRRWLGLVLIALLILAGVLAWGAEVLVWRPAREQEAARQAGLTRIEEELALLQEDIETLDQAMENRSRMLDYYQEKYQENASYRTEYLAQVSLYNAVKSEKKELQAQYEEQLALYQKMLME